MIDVLPDDKLAAISGLLKSLVEPLAVSLENAPVEDEELSEEMSAALARSKAQRLRGETVSHEDILREYGV
jgi:hypothetical protein